MNSNLEKVTQENVHKVTQAMGTRLYPVTFILNPIWIIKGRYYILEEDTNSLGRGKFLTVFKKSQMYGKEIMYAICVPFYIHQSNNFVDHYSAEQLEKQQYHKMQANYDFQLTQYDVDFLGIDTPKEKLHTEFIYKASNYPEGLPGKDFIRWRKVYNTIQSEGYTIELHANKVPFHLTSKMLQVISSWKDDRKKYVANFTEWYVSSLRALDNFLVVAIMNKSKQMISFSISQRIGNQIYFLDEKAHRNLPPLRNQARVQHIEALKYWAKESNNPDILMTSGIGDKKYTHEEHTYDLNEHKRSLKPHLEVTIYKVRKNA